MALDEEINVIEELIIFLQSYSWLYNFPVIQLFSLDIINRLPEEWKHWYQQMNFNINWILSTEEKTTINCPSLCSFIEQCNKFSIASLLQSRCKSLSFESFANLNENSATDSSPEIVCKDFVCIPKSRKWTKDIWKIIKNSNPKKQHEVERLASFMKKVKQYTKSNKVLDIGSGLGYLGFYLHLKYGYKVIGAEKSISNVNSASKERINKLGSSCPSLQFVHWNLEDDLATLESLPQVASFDNQILCTCLARNCFSSHSIQEKNGDVLDFNESKAVDLVSLHSCADLSPIMLKIFAHHPHISSVVSLSCCYHKMLPDHDEEASSLSENSETAFKENKKFKNFPLSRTVSDIMKEKKAQISTFGLRLISEESILHWKERAGENLEEDILNIAYRSILQDVCEKNNLKIKKLKRHCGKKSSYTSFSEYSEVIFEDYQFLTLSGEEYLDTSFLTTQLENRYEELKENIAYVGLIRVLQLTIQPVLEALLLLDRVLYLKENGFDYSGIKELFDETKSPKNKAIFAFKKEYLNLLKDSSNSENLPKQLVDEECSSSLE